MKLHIKKGDLVKANAGSDKSKDPAKVLKVIRKDSKVIVEGYNIVSRHTKPNAEFPDGGIIKKEAPIHISNVSLVVNGTPTKVGRKTNEKGKLQRYSKATGEFIN